MRRTLIKVLMLLYLFLSWMNQPGNFWTGREHHSKPTFKMLDVSELIVFTDQNVTNTNKKQFLTFILLINATQTEISPEIRL